VVAGRFAPATAEGVVMRIMLGVWTVVLIGGLAYFIVIGLTHH
jgi:hypothetical protein